MPRPGNFTINLIVYVNASIGKCPLCGHEEHEKASDEKEEACN
jgi:hypothetical protein